MSLLITIAGSETTKQSYSTHDAEAVSISIPIPIAISIKIFFKNTLKPLLGH